MVSNVNEGNQKKERKRKSESYSHLTLVLIRHHHGYPIPNIISINVRDKTQQHVRYMTINYELIFA